LGTDQTGGLCQVAPGSVSPDDFGKSNNVQWQQHHVREKDGRQPRDRAIGDEGEIAQDRSGA
jgi:hypothetical protein